MALTTTVKIPDLGPGAGYALWGFRAAAIGHAPCSVLVRGYEEVFGNYGRPALSGLHLLARTLGSQGGRRITLAWPGCCRTTADELSVVALLSAAQVEDDALCSAHLSWLMCGRNEEEAKTAAVSVGTIFASAGMTIEKPKLEISGPRADKPFTSFHSPGLA